MGLAHVGLGQPRRSMPHSSAHQIHPADQQADDQHMQIENEYGFCGQPDRPYLEHLVATVRHHLGPDVLIYTTDPPDVLDIGTLPTEVYS